MFKSIRWKLVLMFTLMIVSVILLVGTFFRANISNFYIKDFESRIETALDGEFYSKITEAAKNGTVASIVDVYTGRLGIDLYRNLYLLDGKTADILYRTDGNTFESIEKTSNIISALSGEEGREIYEQNPYMDYAKPVITDGEVDFIIYVKDTKDEVNEIISTILTIILQSLLVGMIIALVIGYFMSMTITAPIISLTYKAEQLAAGEFEAKIDVRAEDEIGQLTNTFNIMAGTLKDTLSKIGDEKNKLETILTFMNDGVMGFDRNGNVIHINPAARRLLAIEDTETVKFDEFFSFADISMEEIVFKINETLQRDITLGDLQLQAFFAAVAQDKVSAVIVVIRDVTEQHKLELSRREFVSNVSHELRTPITTIKSYTETILESEDLPRETMIGFLSVVQSEADRMTRLVFDLLDLSRLDYDIQSMEKDDFDLKELLRDVTDKLSFEADAREHKLSLSFAGNIPMFYGNRDRMEQVITNIIVNAMKYTPDGGDIRVSAGSLYNSIYIKVKDNGIGIPSEDLPHIFDRFYRVDKARSRQSGGTGLGLAIAKEIISAHGGDIVVESNVGEGTLVTIHFPIADHKD